MYHDNLKCKIKLRNTWYKVKIQTSKPGSSQGSLKNDLINAYTCTTHLVIKSSSDVIQMTQQSEKTFLLFVVPDLPKYKFNAFLVSYICCLVT